MIRLPPSGISISQDDLNIHLQRLDIYYGLLKQGFKKKEILKYHNEQKALAQVSTTHDTLLPEQDHRLPSKQKKHVSVERKNVRTEPSVLTGSSKMEEFREVSDHSLDCASTGFQENVTSPDTSRTISPSQSTTPKFQNQDPSDAGPARSFFQKHIPRRSSLLRFTRTMSSESVQDDLETSIDYSPSMNETCCARIQTGICEPSDSDIGIQNTSRGTSLSEELEHLTLSEELLPTGTLLKVISPRSSSLSPLAQEFSPLRLPPPVRTTVQDSRSHASPPSSGYQKQSIRSYGAESIVNSNPELSFNTSSRNLESVEQHETLFPSSPPVVEESSLADESLIHQSSPSLPPVPRTPRLVRHTCSRTEPRYGASRYLDGSFAVYNDSLPANIQPQSPAELTRDTPVSEYSAAYTAPPGMVRSEFARRGHFAYHLRQASGEQSPTSRALTIRGRRQREFVRSAQVEGLRIGRLRQRYIPEASPGQGGVDNQAINEPQERIFEIWRDDLDADRVGEENFDNVGGALAEFGTGMRAFSGNQRAAT